MSEAFVHAPREGMGAAPLSQRALAASQAGVTLPLSQAQEMRLWCELRLSGAALGAATTLLHFGALGWACASAATLGDALSAYARFSRLVSHQAFVHEESSARRVLRWCRPPAEPLPAGYVCFEAVSLVRLLCQILPARPSCVAVPLQRKQVDDSLEERLGCMVRFGASELSVDYERAHPDLANLHADPELHRAGIDLCERALEARLDRETYAERVSAAVLRCRASACAADIARALSVSERTMHRRLREEGTSYQQVCDELRLDRCLRAMSARRMSQDQLAKHLGFADPRGLTRAFRRWTGSSISDFQTGATGLNGPVSRTLSEDGRREVPEC